MCRELTRHCLWKPKKFLFVVFLPAVWGAGWQFLVVIWTHYSPMALGEVGAENLGGVAACGHEPGQLQLGLMWMARTWACTWAQASTWAWIDSAIDISSEQVAQKLVVITPKSNSLESHKDCHPYTSPDNGNFLLIS